jgi:hypothetical protein
MLFMAVLFVVNPGLTLVIAILGGLGIAGHVLRVREQRRAALDYRKNTYGF